MALQDLMLAAGFQLAHTGGGCTAYQIDLGKGREILITTPNGCVAPEGLKDACVVGLYHEGEQVRLVDNVPSLIHALLIVGQWKHEQSEKEQTKERIVRVARAFARYGDATDDWEWSELEGYHDGFWELINQLDGVERERRDYEVDEGTSEMDEVENERELPEEEP
jgi:soluble cytochrome b562